MERHSGIYLMYRQHRCTKYNHSRCTIRYTILYSHPTISDFFTVRYVYIYTSIYNIFTFNLI